jgi:hypothetical protein
MDKFMDIDELPTESASTSLRRDRRVLLTQDLDGEMLSAILEGTVSERSKALNDLADDS